MERLGIEEDDKWVVDRIRNDSVRLWSDVIKETEQHYDYSAKTYRLDKLLMGLPDWCFNWYVNPSMTQDGPAYRLKFIKGNPLVFDEFDYKDKSFDIHDLLELIASSANQKKIEATAKLLILLEEEGLGRGEL